MNHRSKRSSTIAYILYHTSKSITDLNNLVEQIYKFIRSKDNAAVEYCRSNLTNHPHIFNKKTK